MAMVLEVSLSMESILKMKTFRLSTLNLCSFLWLTVALIQMDLNSLLHSLLLPISMERMLFSEKS